jgi:hypothetical protein
MTHIDKYKIYSYGKSWNKGKEAKTETIQKMLTSDECIDGKQFLRLLDDLQDAWHTHENKDCEIEVTFKNTEE